MPHQHATTAQTDSAEISLLSSCPEALHECHFSTLTTSSTHIWAQWTLCPSALARSHCCAQHGGAALADKVPLISELLHLGYSIYTLLCRTICQFICFPIRHNANIHQASLRGGGVRQVLQPNRQSTSCAVPSHWRTQGTPSGVRMLEGKGEKHPRKLSSFGYVLTALVTHSFHASEAGGEQGDQGGGRREKNHRMSI